MLKILIAEDDKFLANAYRVKLTKEGFEVMLAMDGEVAMKLLETFKPDLLILDLVMPKKDGFAVLEEVRQIPRWKKLPIVIASNLGQEEDLSRGMKLGATDYVIKADLSLSDLIVRIKQTLNKV